MSELNSWPPIQQLFQTFHLKLMEAPEEKSGEHQSHQDWGTVSVQNFMAVHLEIFHPGCSHPQNHAAWFPINVIWTALCFPTKHIQLYMNIIFRKLWCWTNGWRHAAFQIHRHSRCSSPLSTGYTPPIALLLHPLHLLLYLLRVNMGHIAYCFSPCCPRGV